MPKPQRRKVAATLFMTLDGVVESPEKWSFPFWNDEIAKFKQEELDATDALLLGRVTYEGFAAAWPGRTDDTGFADKFNSMPKYVASKTLKKADWTNSSILGTDVAADVSKLRQQPGQDIVVHGSVTLINSLIRDDLLDELRVLVYPIVLGKGKRLFQDGTKTDLKLVQTKPFKTGVVGLVYKRAEAKAQVPHPYAAPKAARK